MIAAFALLARRLPPRGFARTLKRKPSSLQGAPEPRQAPQAAAVAESSAAA